MSDVVIVSAARTPIGTFNGALASLSGAQLGTIAIEAALERGGFAAGEVSEVILGQVLTAGTGQNPARQAAVSAGIPADRTALTINQVCGSGLRSVAMAYQAVLAGDSSVVVAGGQESMSQAPHCAPLRQGQKMGDLEFVDTMIRDGLWDAFNGYHMGNTAENVAERWEISRTLQDEFAAASQQKAEAAQRVEELKAHDGTAILNLNYRQGPDLPVLSNGFPDSHFICFPFESRRTGIYAAGCVRQPMDGIGMCGRKAPHALVDRTQRAIAAFESRKLRTAQ